MPIFFPAQHIQIKIIGKGGEEREFVPQNVSWSSGFTAFNEEGKLISPMNVFLGGAALDMDNISALSINGVLVSVDSYLMQ